jgi:hypothetical protein
MQRIKVDNLTVQDFLHSLPDDKEGVELEVDGGVVWKITRPSQLSPAEQEAVIERGRVLLRQTRERNDGVPTHIIEREVNEAVDAVRRRHQR